ncbi:hypothetical protein BD413DRAFT_493807 [Trametes elegans]|nr:hypothetical protein BD413DRAFT_493807 [Trametes elegans]
MRFSSAVFLSGLLTVVSAHFHLQYPTPRGVFVANNEPTFCDGYADAVDNRTVYPLSKGVISLSSGHPQWTLGAIVATVQNPNSFNSFESNGQFQYAVPFFKTSGEGNFCFPLDFSSLNISGVQNNANVTIQLIYDGGDGHLYQCADLTLSDSATVPDSVTCQNATNAAVTPVSSTLAPDATSTSPSSSSSGSSATQSPNAARGHAVVGVSGLAGVVGVVAALL